MKKSHLILTGLALSLVVVFLLVQKNKKTDGQLGDNKESIGNVQGGASHPEQPVSKTSEDSTKNGEQKTAQHEPVAGESKGTIPSEPAAVAKKENNCFNNSYEHQSKNQNRDIEDFLNDTNAFPIAHENVNQKSICVKVNNKPVSHKLVKKGGKAEVLIGAVVGPESTIQVSYCVGTAPCKESCVVKTKNKVDELLSDSEMGGLENAELETQVKELRNVASNNGDLMDSTVIRDWNKTQSKEWVCEK